MKVRQGQVYYAFLRNTLLLVLLTARSKRQALSCKRYRFLSSSLYSWSQTTVVGRLRCFLQTFCLVISVFVHFLSVSSNRNNSKKSTVQPFLHNVCAIQERQMLGNFLIITCIITATFSILAPLPSEKKLRPYASLPPMHCLHSSVTCKPMMICHATVK